jgi:hypothetical protein
LTQMIRTLKFSPTWTHSAVLWTSTGRLSDSEWWQQWFTDLDSESVAGSPSSLPYEKLNRFRH